jgi:hypothetical protein
MAIFPSPAEIYESEFRRQLNTSLVLPPTLTQSEARELAESAYEAAHKAALEALGLAIAREVRDQREARERLQDAAERRQRERERQVKEAKRTLKRFGSLAEKIDPHVLYALLVSHGRTLALRVDDAFDEFEPPLIRGHRPRVVAKVPGHRLPERAEKLEAVCSTPDELRAELGRIAAELAEDDQRELLAATAREAQQMRERLAARDRELGAATPSSGNSAGHEPAIEED